MQSGDIALKGQSISKAITIIENGLRASLDKKSGGDIAVSLDALYEYMSNRLLQANLQNETDYLTEVHSLLRDLKSSWEAIAPEKKAIVPDVPIIQNDPLTPRRSNLYEA